MNKPIWVQDTNPQCLAETLAGDISEHATRCIAERGRAILAFSGGSTPVPLFECLNRLDLDWPSIIITLVDERWVPESHPLSNAALLRRHLLDVPAQFIPLYAAAKSPEQTLPIVLSHYAKVTESSQNSLAPFDLVVLGMGGDGHTASFFPDADNIDQLVDPNSQQPLLTCESSTTKVPRITWSVPMLMQSNFLALHFTGQHKLAVYQQATQPGSATELPIRVAIQQQATPLRVYYAA